MKPSVVQSLPVHYVQHRAVLLGVLTVIVHSSIAAIVAAVVLAPAPRWFVLYEISGTPLPLPSRLAWSLSIWLRRLFPLVLLITPIAFVADALVAGRYFSRSSGDAGWRWFWGVLAIEVVLAVLWIGALLLPRLNL
jgi:hypothetical protein